MTLLAVLFSYILLLAAVPAEAGPSCAKKHYQTQQCIEKCKGRWGYPGHIMGSNAWGNVMQPSAVPAAAWDSMVSQACGMQSSASSSATPINAPVGNIGNDPIYHSVTSASSTQTTSSSTTVRSSSSTTSTLSTSSTSSSSISSSSSSSSVSPQNFAPQTTRRPRPTTSSPPPPPPTTTSTPPPPPPPTTSSKPPPEPTTSQASGNNQNTGSDSSGNSGSSGSSGSSGNSGSTSDSDIQAYLSAHNSVRAQHGAAPLTWSDEAAGKAQQWANNCVFEHSGGKLGPFGENLAAGTGSSYGIAEAIKSWTDEVSDYNSNNPQPSHFTQVVWKATTQVGCAVQSCDGIFDASFGKAKFFVCEYTPQGNVIGQFGENVQA